MKKKIYKNIINGTVVKFEDRFWSPLMDTLVVEYQRDFDKRYFQKPAYVFDKTYRLITLN